VTAKVDVNTKSLQYTVKITCSKLIGSEVWLQHIMLVYKLLSHHYRQRHYHSAISCSL